MPVVQGKCYFKQHLAGVYYYNLNTVVEMLLDAAVLAHQGVRH